MDVSPLLPSLTSAAELGRLWIGERDRQKAAAIQIELTDKITQAQTHVSQLLGAVIDQQALIATLNQRVRDMAAHEAEKERYVLAKVGTDREFFAYRLKAPAELADRADEISHFVCQPCFERGQKVVLCGNGAGYGERPVCKLGAQT